MAKLADDWDDGRQTCINVLCAKLRRGWTPRPEGDDADPAALLAFADDQEFRHTIIAVIATRLRHVGGPWQGCNRDFRGATFCGGTVTFDNARFSSGGVHLGNVASFAVPPRFGFGPGALPAGVVLPAGFLPLAPPPGPESAGV